MARGRMLNKKISRDVVVGELARRVGTAGALFYTWLIAHLDRDGRMDGEPVVLKGAVVPWMDECTVEVIEATLQAADDLGLIDRYTVHGQRFVSFPKFAANQTGFRYDRENPSEIPPPSADPDSIRIVSGALPDEDKTRERKGKERARRIGAGSEPEAGAHVGQVSSSTPQVLVRSADELADVAGIALSKRQRRRIGEEAVLPVPVAWAAEAASVTRAAPGLLEDKYGPFLVTTLANWKRERAWPGTEQEAARLAEDKTRQRESEPRKKKPDPKPEPVVEEAPCSPEEAQRVRELARVSLGISIP
jgi:hypothetical protein